MPAEADQVAARVPTAAGRQPLVVVLLAVAAGMMLDRALAPALWGEWFLAIAAWLGWLLFYRRRWHHPAAAALLLAAAGLGAAWHQAGWRWFAGDEIGRFARSQAAPVCLSGRALAVPALLPAPPYDPMRSMVVGQQSRLLVEVEALRDRDRWRTASGRVTVWATGQMPAVRPGQRVQVFGQLAAEVPAANPGEHDFSSDARRDRRLCSVRSSFPECVSLVSLDHDPPRLSRVADWFAELRARGDQLLWQYLSHRRAGLATAVLLGDRSELARDETEAFVETGTSHLLAISGLNVGILAAGLSFALRLGWLSRRFGLALVAGLTVFYALLTDSQPPVLRATILVVAFCVSLSSGRRTAGLNTLALAALVVLAINPADLFRVGPQLSFLGVAVLIWFAPRWQHRPASLDPLDRLLAAARPWPWRTLRAAGSWLASLTVAGVAVGLVSLPLVMREFHLFSPAGVLLTPLLFLPMATAMFGGLGVLLFGRFLSPLATVCGGVCDVSLSLISGAVEAARALPGSYAWVAGPPAWWVAVFYIALATGVIWPGVCPRRRWCAALLCGWIAVGVIWAVWHRNDGDLRCTILSVGHGSAVVLELPDGRSLVADAGRLGSPGPAADAVAGYLWSRGRTHIDAIVISHADSDHYNAVPRLLERFSVGAVYVSPVMLKNKSHGVMALFEAIRQAGVPVKTIHAGDRLDTPAARIDVLHPPARGVLAADKKRLDNANSIVLAVEYRGRRILLPGDLEGRGLDDVVAESRWDCDVLMAPHHGSAQSDPPGFAAWCTPEWTVVSGSFDENLSAAGSAYGTQGGRLLHTARDGAVRVILHDGGLKVEAWRNRGVSRSDR